MIKKGDIFCCKSENATFIVGNFYEIKWTVKNAVSIYAIPYNTDINDDKKLYPYKYFRTNLQIGTEWFYNYFMTPAEWRDKQINSILDD
jgi:hypothetical protein